MKSMQEAIVGAMISTKYLNYLNDKKHTQEVIQNILEQGIKDGIIAECARDSERRLHDIKCPQWKQAGGKESDFPYQDYVRHEEGMTRNIWQRQCARCRKDFITLITAQCECPNNPLK